MTTSWRSLKRPRRMVDLRAEEHAVARRVQAVALGQEVLERPLLGWNGDPGGPVAAVEAVTVVAPPAEVVHRLAEPVCPHGRVVVRERVREPCRLDRESTLRVEAEEPDPRLVRVCDVRPHVELEEAREPGHGERRTQ